MRHGPSAATRRTIGAYIALFAAIGALFPYIPVYYESLGLGLSVIGLLAAASAIAAMLGAPLWGATADHLGPARPVLAVAATCAAAAAAALALVTGTLVIAAAAVALAIAMAGITPILDSRAMEVVGAGSARYAQLRVWGSASFVVAVVVTGWLVELSGIRAMFVVLVPMLMATAIVGLGVRSGPSGATLPRLTALESVLRSAAVMPFLGVLLLCWTAVAAINAFFSIHLVSIGAPASLVGIAWALGAVVEVPIMLAFPWLARLVGLHRLLVAGAILFALRAFAIVLTDDPMLVTLTMLLHGGAFAVLLVGGVMFVSEHAPPGAAATAQGMLSGVVFGLAQVLGSGVGGMLGQGLGLPWMFALAGLGSGLVVVGLTIVLARASAAPGFGTKEPAPIAGAERTWQEKNRP